MSYHGLFHPANLLTQLVPSSCLDEMVSLQLAAQRLDWIKVNTLNMFLVTIGAHSKLGVSAAVRLVSSQPPQNSCERIQAPAADQSEDEKPAQNHDQERALRVLISVEESNDLKKCVTAVVLSGT